ncbi:hypothetical protein TSUD_258970 [Trifolium subterraneum]|uniref:F-box/LRR-repeat protein 15-like leucin rich repeat domain-containing protein n=1 Tax=Trifolium subterraneum TaxID=3900 RepID=A0A2Z6NGA7_TRISU|nr:hypothetical protein TSUD_258970 [Trifolium subterraneum]
MKRQKTTRNSFKSSSSQTTKTITAKEEFHLPDDCWESIFNFLIDGDDDNNRRYLESFSLASKDFLSITNRLRSSFTIIDPTFSTLLIPILFHRFPNLTSLHITSYFQYDLNTLLCHISQFPFKLKSLKLPDRSKFPAKGLRVLSKKIKTLTSLTIAVSHCNHFVLISDCFPFLEELHLQNSNTLSFNNFGFKAMLIALPKLRKINLSGGFYDVNGDSLFLHLCENCEFLEDIVMLNLEFLSQDCIASAIRQRPTLRSLTFRSSSYFHHNISSHFIDSLISLKGLNCLDLSGTQISDELLSTIAVGELPLRRLVLQYCTGYSYAGIFSLLSKCQHIQHLDLQKAKFLTDQNVVELSMFLGDLMFINLSECRKLTDSTMFALVRNCPSLTDIKMEHTRVGKNIVENSNSLNDFVLNPKLKSLYLARSSRLRDESLIMFASIFPNLQLLDLRDCLFVSEEGICQVLRRCCKIRHLNLAKCNVAKLLIILNFQVPMLEVLNLSDTSVDDETLYMISKNCCGLLQLLLESCNNITKKGVKHVVKNCKQLIEIDLGNCDKLCENIVGIMLRSRPSLRKIIAPPRYHLSNNIRELCSHRGCHIRGCLIF